MHIAQLNIAEAKDSIESKTMADFVNNTDRINALADSSAGFIWRFKANEVDNAYGLQLWKSEFTITNMSIWKDRKSLFDFVYNSVHVDIMKRKKEWFHKMPKMHMVLWKVTEGHVPTVEEAKERLEYLQKHGESEHAFTFKSNF